MQQASSQCLLVAGASVCTKCTTGQFSPSGILTQQSIVYVDYPLKYTGHMPSIQIKSIKLHDSFWSGGIFFWTSLQVARQPAPSADLDHTLAYKVSLHRFSLPSIHFGQNCILNLCNVHEHWQQRHKTNHGSCNFLQWRWVQTWKLRWPW